MTRKRISDLLREEQGKNPEQPDASEEVEVNVLLEELTRVRAEFDDQEQKLAKSVAQVEDLNTQLEQVRKDTLKLAEANTQLVKANDALRQEVEQLKQRQSTPSGSVQKVFLPDSPSEDTASTTYPSSMSKQKMPDWLL